MNNDLMLVSRELLQLAYRNAIGGAANLTTEEFLRVQRELKALLAAPTAQAVDDKEFKRLIAKFDDLDIDDYQGWANEAFDAISAALAEPAQSEQEPVGWQFYQDGKWWNGDDRIKDHRVNTEAAGYQTRDVYAAPVRAVRLPERHDLPHRDEFESADQHAAAVEQAAIWNACRDEVARLNAQPAGPES